MCNYKMQILIITVQISTDPDRSLLSWIPLKLPENCKMFVSCTRDNEMQSESHDYTHHYNVLSARLDNPLLVIHLGHLGPELGLTVRQLTGIFTNSSSLLLSGYQSPDEENIKKTWKFPEQTCSQRPGTLFASAVLQAYFC